MQKYLIDSPLLYFFLLIFLRAHAPGLHAALENGFSRTASTTSYGVQSRGTPISRVEERRTWDKATIREEDPIEILDATCEEEKTAALDNIMPLSLQAPRHTGR